MTKYAYQIQGALENAEGRFCGFRVLVGNADFMDLADVPAEVFSKETVKNTTNESWVRIEAQPLTTEAFAPFGTSILPSSEATQFMEQSSNLCFHSGTPR